MKMFKKFGRMVLILMLVVIIALMPCLNAYAFAITSSTTAIMALLALSGVTLMSANIPDSVAQNMYRDISTIASNTGHALYDSANAILDFTADYSVKVANATGEMIEVSGVNLSNAIGGLKNYLTYKNVNGAYEGLVITNSSNSLNLEKMATVNLGLSSSNVISNVSYSATNTSLMAQFSSLLNGVLLSNTVLHSTKKYYDMSVDGFLDVYTEFDRLNLNQYTSLAEMNTALSTCYNWLTGTFGNYIESVKFNDVKLSKIADGLLSVEFISFLLKDGLITMAFVRDASGSFVGYHYSDGEIRNNSTWDSFGFTALPLAYFIGKTTTGGEPRIMAVLPSGSTSSNSDIRYGLYTRFSLSRFYDGGINPSYSNSAVTFGDTVAFSSSAVSVPRVDTSLDGQDVYGVPDIPDSVISGQYNSDVADRIGAVVGGADVIGLNVPVDTGADVYNPSIDALIGSGTLTSDVVIDGTTIATGTDVITGVDTAVGDLVSTGDTVLDLDTTPGTPGGTPSFPDVFPGLWDWVNNLVDNALQWFIFCGDVFGALPGAIKYTFLGGMTTVLAVGVIKKLLF